MKNLVISHLYPSPGVERHLFVHEQLLALRDLGVEAQGTPVIAGEGEGPEDFIEDGASGYLVPVRSPGAPASIIAEVLDDPAKAAAVGEAGRAAALELSWERNAKLTLGVYEKALAAAP